MIQAIHNSLFTLLDFSVMLEDVITARRNVAIAEGRVVTARAKYAKTLFQFGRTTETLLERNSIEISEAVDCIVKGRK